MPIDQKRINGPEASVPYALFYNDSDKPQLKRNEKLLTRRSNGRQHGEHRQIFVKTGIISQAKGSAYIELGSTKVVCSVFDPREIPNKNEYSVHGELFCEFKYAPFSCSKRKIHQQDDEEKEFSLVMQRALEPAVFRQEFPNFQVDIYALVIDNQGCSLAAAIMGASLALADASVPMVGLVTAVTIGLYGETMFIDPTVDEEILCSSSPSKAAEFGNHGIVVQASLPQHTQVSEFVVVGVMDIETIKRVNNVLNTINDDICPIIQQCLVKTVMAALKRDRYERAEINE